METQFKVGQTVWVKPGVSYETHPYLFIVDMDKTIGYPLTVLAIEDSGSIKCECAAVNDWWRYPPDVLETDEERNKRIADEYLAAQSDPINPEHYKAGGIETIAFIKAKLTPEEYAGYLKGNVIKYVSRASYKGAELVDLQKATWYINELTEFLSSNQ